MQVKHRSIFSVFCLSVAILLSQFLTVLAAEWLTYINPRFGTSAQIPASGFVADPPPENGDGQGWTSIDGQGFITISGSFLTIGKNLAEFRQWMEDTSATDDVDITYSDAKDNWFAYAGFRGSEIIYIKVLMSETCGTPILNHIFMQYPKAQVEAYAPIAKRLSDSLTGSNPRKSCN